MADACVELSSSSIADTTGSSKAQSNASNSFPLYIENDNNRKRIKWTGSFDQLKSFANIQLKLSGHSRFQNHCQNMVNYVRNMV